MLPADGIYAARVLCRSASKEGALYIGRRPTFDGTQRAIEVHVLDLDSQDPLNLYGEELAVQLLTRLREDQRFSSKDELEAKIRADVEATREFFSRRAD